MNMDMVKYFAPENTLSEIYSNNQYRFAFLSPDNRMCHQWVFCRDFLHDAVSNFINKTSFGIYGFKYESSNPPISLNKTRILVGHDRVAEGDMRVYLGDALKVIHLFEKAMRFTSRGEIVECGLVVDEYHKLQTVFVFEGSRFWMKSPYMISLLTLLLRVGSEIGGKSFKNINSILDFYGSYGYKSRTGGYMSKLGDNRGKLEYILKNRKTLLANPNWFLVGGGHIRSFHDKSGILGTLEKDVTSL